jgi:hypothetical protein
MGCSCGGGAATNKSNTLGYYVILPSGVLVPPGVNPDDPDSGEPPFFFYNEARAEVLENGGGTIKRLKRNTAAA